MSRIHDALKKAELEKAAGAGAETGARSAGLPEPEAARGEGVPGVMLESPATPALGAGEGRSGQITLETLLARCSRPPWSPKPEGLVFLDSPRPALGAEEFRTLRSRLYLVRQKQPLQTLLITSALPLEGKTFVAANLAHVFVQQQECRALLIDADLRWSRLHLSLGAPLAPGLSEYLQGKADEFSILQRGPQGNLFFIAGGKSAAYPAELIANGRFKGLLQRLAPVFDWIVIDSPPAIPVSDASLLAELCDGMLMVVQAGTTPFDLAQKVCEGFRTKRLLGVVLNRAAPRSAYGSYYYGGYGEDGGKGKRRR
jgi:protein-tyrosine kinase